MADPLSFATGILAVTQLAAKLTSLGYGYISGVKRAPDDLKDLTNELLSLSRVVSILQVHADSSSTARNSALYQLNSTKNSPLQVCYQVLQKLLIRMEPKDGFRGFLSNMKWPLEENETAQHIARIERHKTLFMFALQADQTSLSKVIELYTKNIDAAMQTIQADVGFMSFMVKEIATEVGRTNSIVRGTNETLQHASIALSDLNIRSMEEFTAQKDWRDKKYTQDTVNTRNQFLHWVYPGDFSEKHLRITEARQRNTGRWLMRTPNFQNFMHKDLGSSLLWGYGIPGVGKTFLSSSVIDYLHDHATTAPEKYAVAHFYFDYKQQGEQRPTVVLSSLVKQLASHVLSLPEGVEHIYERKLNANKRLDLEELYSILTLLFHQFDRVFLVFDALDECHPEKQRKALLPLFHRMGEDGARVFFTSRQHPEDIQESFRDIEKIELLADEEDIKTYISEKIEGTPRTKRLVQQGKCKEQILSEITACSKGMFILVKFHTEYICQQITAKKIFKVLEKLKSSPTGDKPLDPTYDRIIENINRQFETSELAIKVLSWIVKAQRPLTIEEIQWAVSIEPNQYELDELDLPDRATILESCASLVVIDGASSIIRLAHYTVQEYLLRKSIIPDDADQNIAIVCTTLLSFNTSSKSPCIPDEPPETLCEKYPFLDYAAKFLSFHLKNCDETLSIEPFLRFIARPQSIYSYRLITDPVVSYWKQFNHSPPKEPPLHVAAALGHSLAVRLLLEGTNSISIPERNGRILTLDASTEDEQVSRLLYGKSDVSSIDTYRNTALHKATSKGNKEIVHILLEKGANPHLRGNDGRTPFQIAVQDRNKPMVSLFLAGGVDTSTRNQGPERLTVLHEAVLSEDVEMVALLLGAGADISARSKSGLTVLHLAVQRKNIVIADLLLRAGAEVSARSKFGVTALHFAVQHWIVEMVDLLLKAGADTSGKYSSITRTILHEAVARRNVEAVRLLLEAGVVPSTPRWSEILLEAIRYSDLEILGLLLKARAGTILEDPSIATIMVHEAVVGGSARKLELLLQAGAVPTTGSGVWTILIDMINHGNEIKTALFLKVGENTLWKDPSLTELILYEAVGTKWVEGFGSTYGEVLDIPLRALLNYVGRWGRMLHFKMAFKNGRAIHLLLVRDTGGPAKDGCGNRALDIIIKSFKDLDYPADSSTYTKSNWVVGMLIDFEGQWNPPESRGTQKIVEKLKWIELTFPTSDSPRQPPPTQTEEVFSPTSSWVTVSTPQQSRYLVGYKLEILSQFTPEYIDVSI